jgi:hypothetical protein
MNAWGGDFGNLSTERFRVKLRPAAISIYQDLWPGCEIADLREQGVKVHVLDQEFGIDTLCTLASGQWLSVQEKYRKHSFLMDTRYRVDRDWPDFTQEYMNAAGTEHEAPGEWFKLGAQLYFYGWANDAEDGFAAWVILNIAKYKLLVEKSGGLDGVGRLQRNKQHGRATFYCIPLPKIASAIVRQRGFNGLHALVSPN